MITTPAGRRVRGRRTRGRRVRGGAALDGAAGGTRAVLLDKHGGPSREGWPRGEDLLEEVCCYAQLLQLWVVLVFWWLMGRFWCGVLVDVLLVTSSRAGVGKHKLSFSPFTPCIWPFTAVPIHTIASLRHDQDFCASDAILRNMIEG